MGFAAGFAAGTQAKLGKQELRLKQGQALLTSNAGILESLSSQSAEIAKQARLNGASEDQILKAIEPFRRAFERSALDDVRIRAEILGQPMPPEGAMSVFNGSMAVFDAGVESGMLQQTPEEEAIAEAQAGVAGTKATAESLTAAGAPTSIGEAAIAAGQKLAPEPAPSPDVVNFRLPDNSLQAVDQNDPVALESVIAAGGVRATLSDEPDAASVINFRMPDGSLRAVDAKDADAVQNAIENGGVKVTLGVQSTSLDELGGLGETSDKKLQEFKDAAASINSSIEEVSGALKDFTETPEAGGLAGPVIEKVGGLLQQADKVLGTDLTGLTGVDPAEVKRVRSNALAVASSMIETITKEESGRFTDTERKIAGEVLGTLNETASNEQILSALESGRSMLERSESRNLARLHAASGLDITVPDEQEKFVKFLMGQGFTEDRAIDALLSLEQRLGIQ